MKILRLALAALLIVFALPGAALGHHVTVPGCEQISFSSSTGWTATLTPGNLSFGPFTHNGVSGPFGIAAGDYAYTFRDAQGSKHETGSVEIYACEQPVATPTPTPEPTATPAPTLDPVALTGSGRCNPHPSGFLDHYVYTFHGTPGAVVDVAGDAAFNGPLGLPLNASGVVRNGFDNTEVWARYRGDEGAGIHVTASACPGGPVITLPPTAAASIPTEPTADIGPVAGLLLAVGGLALLIILPRFRRRSR